MGLASQSARSGSRRAYMSSGRRRRRPVWRWAFVLLAITLLAWWWLGGDEDPSPVDGGGSTTTREPVGPGGVREVTPPSTGDRGPTSADDEGPVVTIDSTPPPRGPGAVQTSPPNAPSTPVQPAPSTTPLSRTTATVALQEAARLLGTDPIRARRQLTQAWLAGLDDVSRATATTHARRLADVTLLDCRDADGSPFLIARTVAPDESLGLIRQRDSIRFGIDFLATVNGLDDPNRIKAGQVLRIPRGDFDAVVDLSSRDLAIFQNTGDRRDLLLVVPIEIGRAGDTPTGDFRVRTASMRRRHHRIGLEPRRPEDRDAPAVQGLELVATSEGGTSDGRSIRLKPEDAALVYELLGARDAATVEIRE